MVLIDPIKKERSSVLFHIDREESKDSNCKDSHYLRLLESDLDYGVCESAVISRDGGDKLDK